MTEHAHKSNAVTRKVPSVGHGARCVARISSVAGGVTAFTERETTSPVPKIAPVSAAASEPIFVVPLTDLRPRASVASRRRRNLRYSLVQKQTARTKNAMIPLVSVRRRGRPRQYGALRSSGRKLATRHTLAQHSPAQ